MSIKVCNAALDQSPSGDIVLRGVIHPDSLSGLRVAPYQREVLPISSLSRLIKAIKAGTTLPDIELGMRGQKYIERGGCFHLQDDVYIVDGLQRVTEDKGFVLGNRVCWQQHMTRGDLLSALAFAKIIGMAHSHLGPNRNSKYDQLAEGLQTTMEHIGKGIMRDNARSFFDLVDSCWGIRRIVYTEGAAYMRQNFLMALAEVISGHTDFWRDNRLFVEASLIRKIKLFPVGDPNIEKLASSSGPARQMLIILLIDHINSGKRTKRLTPRRSFDPVVDDSEDASDAA